MASRRAAMTRGERGEINSGVRMVRLSCSGSAGGPASGRPHGTDGWGLRPAAPGPGAGAGSSGADEERLPHNHRPVPEPPRRMRGGSPARGRGEGPGYWQRTGPAGGMHLRVRRECQEGAWIRQRPSGR
ncbi:hypothetical protein GCM10020367_11890 [Streptomyces sannanensis]|uniref:Uncharacterized protein n=1 Tax=Streptomyces sannanensis TaxID=285536 RepID=A0ABP6S774_9ACTN